MPRHLLGGRLDHAAKFLVTKYCLSLFVGLNSVSLLRYHCQDWPHLPGRKKDASMPDLNRVKYMPLPTMNSVAAVISHSGF